jgi:UDP-N-acetylmuramoyl-tripeptide--D-alanyl-D-alanine ligase
VDFKYDLSELCHWMQVHYPYYLKVSGICIDSRLIQPGNLYFALKGARVDGHYFLEEVQNKGACAAVVDRIDKGPSNLHLIVVEDVLQALQKIAKKAVQKYPRRIVAVTGSLGKTTVKEFIAHLTSKKFRVWASPRNHNSQAGLPLMLLNQLQDEELLIVEMGMTHPQQISRLIKMVPPDIALITTTALVHACNFEGLKQIGLAKAEIFAHPKTQLGILDRGIINFDQLAKKGKCPKVSFAFDNAEADYSLKKENGQLIIQDGNACIPLPHLELPGKHNLHNVLAACVVARQLGMEWAEIVDRVDTLVLPEKRLQTVDKNGVTFINDSYNAAEASVKAALSCLPAAGNGGKRIAVLGEMLELGKFTEACHRAVGEFALNQIDHMICLGKQCEGIYAVWKEANRPVEWFMDLSKISERLKEIMKPGDVILLKGSRSNELWKILDHL